MKPFERRVQESSLGRITELRFVFHDKIFFCFSDDVFTGFLKFLIFKNQ